MTKKQVADAIGITERAYITYEYGQRDISTETLTKLADFYGVTTDYLLGREDPPDCLETLDKLAKENDFTRLEQELLKQYMELPHEARMVVVDFLNRAVENAKPRPQS